MMCGSGKAAEDDEISLLCIVSLVQRSSSVAHGLCAHELLSIRM